MNLETLTKKDHAASEKMRINDRQKFLKVSLTIIAHSGDSWFWLAGLAAVWLFSHAAWHARAAFLGVGLFILSAVVLAIKFIFKRPRPQGEWGKIYRVTDPHSFPSGHAARAAALAVMALGVGPLWFAIVLIIWAPLVALARVMLGVHYISDVVVGLVVGVFLGGLALLLQPLMLQWLPFLFSTL